MLDARYCAIRVPSSILLVALTLIGTVFGAYLIAAGSSPDEGSVPRADCGPGSRPETGIQGQVPLADRESGRSREGYRCNLELVGQQQGDGSSWVSESYGDCAYLARRFIGNPQPGVQVIDASDPSHPKLGGKLTTPGMRAPWETLRIERRRGLMAAVFVPVPPGGGGGFLDVYDLKDDCRSPRRVGSISLTALLEDADRGGLLGAVSNTLDAAQLFGHEANWSPDGTIYWSAAGALGRLSAIDMTDPAKPRLLWAGSTGILNHGFGFSADGNQLYIAETGSVDQAVTAGGLGALSPSANGLKIFDISDIQARRPNPQIHELGHLFWTDGGLGQHTIAISYAGHPYVVFVDEAFQGAARIIDIADPTRPQLVSKLKLEIQMPEAEALRAQDLPGEGFFGYEAHYCTVDREVNPSAMACGYFQSGIRVFDIRDPLHPREIAYFNPPAQTGDSSELTGSEHAGAPGQLNIAQGPSAPGVHGPAELTADWCSSPPRFVGRQQLWVACQDNGFMVLRFTNRAYPIARLRLSGHPLRPGVGCRRFRFRVTTPVRGRAIAVAGARVRMLGRTVRTNQRGRALITTCLGGDDNPIVRATKGGYRRGTQRLLLRRPRT